MGAVQETEKTPAQVLAEKEQDTVPVSFRLSTHWKLERGQAGLTQQQSRRISLSEALDLLLQCLADDECTMTSDGTVTTIVIDWSKVPRQVRDPFFYGVKR